MDEIDFDAHIDRMTIDELLEHQQALTRHRKAVLARAAEVQAELDARAAQIAERRRQEDELLGQAGKPPTQNLLGNTETEA